MRFARVSAQRGTCDRRRVGAVIVSQYRVIATGYNGAPVGWPSCDEEGHQMVTIGDRESCVRTVHAEENAILQCARHGVSPQGGTIYTTSAACYDCLKRIAQVGIRRVVYTEEYGGGRDAGLDVAAVAKRCGVQLDRLCYNVMDEIHPPIVPMPRGLRGVDAVIARLTRFLFA